MALLVKIGADLKSFNSKMKRASSDISYLGTSISNAGRTMTRGVTLPLVGLAIAAGKVGMDYEAQMNRVAAISGATGGELDMLKEKARELGKSTMFSATEAGEGLENFARAGFSAQESVDAIGPSLNLAIASGSDMATVTNIVASAIKGFGLEAKDAAKISDLLASVTANSNTNLEALGEAFNYVAPLANTLGYSAEDTAEALGLMAQAGITGSTAGTSLRTALTNLASPTAEAQKMMKQLGIEVADAEGNMLPFDDVTSQLRDTFAGLSEEEKAQAASTLFGKRAMSGMLAVIDASEEDINKLADATTDYNGVVKEQADIMQSGSKGGLQVLKSSLQELAISLSETLLPIFNKVIEKVQGLVDKFNALSPEQKEQVLKIAAIVAAIGPMLVIIGKAISIFGKLRAVFKIVKGAMKAFGAVTSLVGAGPIVLIIAAIAALIAIGILIYKNWDVIVAWLKQAWQDISDFAVNLWNSVAEFFVGLWESIINGILTAWNSVAEFFTNLWQGIIDAAILIWENLKLFFETFWMGIVAIFQFYAEYFKSLFNIFTLLLQGDWAGAWNAIKDLFSGVWDKIKTILKTCLDFILGLFGTDLETLKGNIDEKIGKIKEIFTSLKEKVQEIVNKIKAIWQGFKLPTFTLKMAVKTFLGRSITYPTGFSINWHADGGIFTKPTVLGGHGFGEAGKEAILPLDRLPGLLGLDQNQGNIIQVYIGDELICEYIDNALGKRLLGGL